MIQHIHLLGICGTGMAALAGILEGAGLSGDRLRRTRLPAHEHPAGRSGDPHPKRLSPGKPGAVPDLVVVGNVIRRDNPEAQAVLAQDLPRLSLPEALNRFLVGERQSLVVAGTHGKTTTTALIAWLLFALGAGPRVHGGGHRQEFSDQLPGGPGPLRGPGRG